MEIDFDKLLRNYNSELTTKLRGFNDQFDYLQYWVPGSDKTSSLMNLIDAMHETGVFNFSILILKEDSYLVEEIRNISKDICQSKINLDKITDNQYNNLEIIEVKTSAKTSQISKFKNLGVANSGYELLASSTSNNNKENGLIIFEKNVPKIFKGNNYSLNKEASVNDKKWFNTYLKVHLIANLKLSEINSLLLKKTSHKKLMSDALINLLEKLTFKEILEKINNGL